MEPEDVSFLKAKLGIFLHGSSLLGGSKKPGLSQFSRLFRRRVALSI